MAAANAGAAAAGGIALEEGAIVVVKYTEEPDLWHARLLLKTCTPAMMTSITGEAHAGGPVWWIASADGDIYPEELAVPPLLGLMSYRHGRPDIENGLGDTSHSRRVHGSFRNLSFRDMMEMVRACERAEQPPPRRRVTGKKGPGPASSAPGPGPAAPTGPTLPGAMVQGPLPPPTHEWVILRSSSANPDASKGVLEVKGQKCLRVGNLAMVFQDGDVVLASDESSSGPGKAKGSKDGEAEVDVEDLDARVLSIVRDSEGQRRKDFRTAVGEITTTEWA